MIILNEKEYAEDCLKGRFNSDKPLLSVAILARYYYHCKKYKRKQIISALMEFLEQHYPQYRRDADYWTESIEKVVDNAKKYPLHEIDGVWITEAELITIDSINDDVLARLAFTILCLAKLNNMRNPKCNGWINTDDKEVFKLARISGTVAERRVLLGRLCKMGLLENSKRIDNTGYRATYIDDESPQKLLVSDFRELGYEYYLYKGENYTRCCECNILIPNNKNRTKKYCSACSAPTPMITKWLSCSNCGDKFEVRSHSNRSMRCPACQRVQARELARIRKQRSRNKSDVTLSKKR